MTDFNKHRYTRKVKQKPICFPPIGYEFTTKLRMKEELCRRCGIIGNWYRMDYCRTCWAHFCAKCTRFHQKHDDNECERYVREFVKTDTHCKGFPMGCRKIKNKY